MVYAIPIAHYYLKRVQVLKVQERLGHTDVKTTMDIYTHVTKKTKASTIEKFDAYINAR